MAKSKPKPKPKPTPTKDPQFTKWRADRWTRYFHGVMIDIEESNSPPIPFEWTLVGYPDNNHHSGQARTLLEAQQAAEQRVLELVKP